MGIEDKGRIVVEKLMQRADRSKKPIIVNVSNRHFHCTQEVFEKLYGAGKKPTKKKDLLQPGQFACEETVTVRGTKGTLENVRMIGPLRPYTQVELSTTDTFTLGVRPPVRDSGNIKGSAPITIVGPQGSVDLPEGAIVAQRHIHFHPDEAKDFGVKNMETVRIKLGEGTPKETIFTILCRVREDMKLECHLDTDEANAAGIKNGDTAVML